MSGLKKLRILTLSGNNLSEIPESIGELTNLEELHLDSNKITQIPEFISKLKLDFSSNKITEIPGFLSKLKKLEKLSLQRNEVDRTAKSKAVSKLEDALPDCWVIA